jgi:hypothetical protein
MLIKHLLALSLLLSAPLIAANVSNTGTETHTFGLARISNITDGYFGAKRVYYTLKCNEIFTSTLTQSTSTGVLAVGILKEIQPRSCNTAPRQEWQRVIPEGRSVTATTSFNEVWECRGICYIISDPVVDPYQKVVKYGTSEDQTRERLPCPPADQVEMLCRTIELAE